MKKFLLFFIPRFKTEWCYLSHDTADKAHYVYPLTEIEEGEKPEFFILIRRFEIFNRSFFHKNLTDFVTHEQYKNMGGNLNERINKR